MVCGAVAQKCMEAACALGRTPHRTTRSPILLCTRLVVYAHRFLWRYIRENGDEAQMFSKIRFSTFLV